MFFTNFHCRQPVDMKTICTFLLLALSRVAFAQLIVSPEVFEFGRVREHERPVGTITLTNRGAQPVSVTRIMRTCACSEATIDHPRIAPGESATVSFWLDPNDLAHGPFYKSFYVRTDHPEQPVVMLAMRGEVVPLWQVEPGRRIDLGRQAGTAVFRLRPSPAAPAIGGLTVAGAGEDVSAVLTTNATDGVLSLAFTPPPDLEPGSHEWRIQLHPVEAGAHPLVLKVSREVASAWEVSPRVLRLPSSTDRPFTALVHLRPITGAGGSAVLDPAAITLTPRRDEVALTPEGQSYRKGYAFRLTISPERVNAWDASETFFFSIPEHATPSSPTGRVIRIQGPTILRNLPAGSARSETLPPAGPVFAEIFTQAGCDDCEWVRQVFLPRAAARYGSNLVVQISYTTERAVLLRLLGLLESRGIRENAPVYLAIAATDVLAGRKAIDAQAFALVDARLEGEGSESRLAEGLAPSPVHAATPSESPPPDAAIADRLFARFTVPAVAIAGLADGFNPCAFATVVFLTSLLAAGGRSRRVRLLGGMAFCIASFLTYFLMGFGLLRAVRALDAVQWARLAITFATASALVVFAVLSVVDAVRFHRRRVASAVILQLPSSVKRRIHGISRVCFGGPAVLLGGLLCGAGVTLLESVCTGQLYLPLLVWLSREGGGARAWSLLLLYNAAFILPLFAVFLLAAFGMQNQRLADWSRRHVVPAKLLLALVFIALAVLLLV